MKKPIFVCCLVCILLYFSCTQKTPPVDKPAATADAYTEIDFYGEWFCETQPQKIAEGVEMAGSRDTYIFYDNNTYESNFIVTGEEDDPIKYRGKFSISNSNIIITPEQVGTLDGSWIETKGLSQGPFSYPYKFIDGRLQINDEIYTKIAAQ